MKLIIVGASGYVGQEIVRQSLRIPKLTSVIAVSRKPITQPSEGAEKLNNVTVEDYDRYPDEVKKEFAGANACIWTIAITPSKSKTYNFDEVRRVCQASTVAGLNAMYDAGPAKPFRFMYMSGQAASRDPTAPQNAFFKMMGMQDYLLMRGETENKVVEFAAKHPGEVEAGFARPAIITSTADWGRSIAGLLVKVSGVVDNISREDIVAVMLNEVLNGFSKGIEALDNNELRQAAAALKNPSA